MTILPFLLLACAPAGNHPRTIDAGPCPREDDGFGPAHDPLSNMRCGRRVELDEGDAACGPGRKRARSVGSPREWWCETAPERYDGPYERWYTHEVRAVAGMYADGVPHGPWTFWAADGGLLEQGSYERGQREGEWRRFWPGGRVAERAWWHAGVLHGRLERYFLDGRSRLHGAHIDGERDGTWEEVYHSGLLKARLRYERGVLKTAEYFDASQKPTDSPPPTGNSYPPPVERSGPRPRWTAHPERVDLADLTWHGVGKVDNIPNAALRRTTADNRARAELAKALALHAAATIERVSRDRSTAVLASNEAERGVCGAINGISHACYEGMALRERWTAPGDPVTYAHVSLQFDDCLWAIDGDLSIEPDVRRQAWKYAAFVMGEIEEDLLRAR